MGGGKFSKSDEANENAARFGHQHQRNQPKICSDDRAAQNPCDGEYEHVINEVGDAVITAKGRGGDAEFARKGAVKNIRERGGDQNGQKDKSHDTRERARQGDWSEQQSQGGEREGEVAFHSAAQLHIRPHRQAIHVQ